MSTPALTPPSYYRQQLRELELLPASAPFADLILAALADNRLQTVDLQTIRDLRRMQREDAPDERLDLMLACMMLALNTGSACLRFDADAAPEAWLNRLLALPEPVADWIAGTWDRIRESLTGGQPWPDLVQHATGGETIRRPVVTLLRNGRSFLYFQRYYRHEQGLRECLDRLAGRGSGSITPDTARAQTGAAALYHGFSLSAEQRMGLYLALRQMFVLITGGPGTGKTTVICSLLRALLSMGVPPERIALAAPTGRAGQRMGEAIRDSLDKAVDVPDEQRESIRQMQGSTIHRLLKYDPRRDAFAYSETHPLPLDVLIVDEVSMVDLVLMHRLLQALPTTCRVVFLGDKDQLPSVDAGTVLGDLVPRDCQPAFSPDIIRELKVLDPDLQLVSTDTAAPLTDRIILLPRSHRNKGNLAVVAAAINQGLADNAMEQMTTVTCPPQGLADWTSPPQACVHLVGLDTADPASLQALVLSWTRFFMDSPGPGSESLRDLVRRAFPVAALEGRDGTEAEQREARERADRIFERMGASRILTVLRRGPFGSEAVNRHASRHWRHQMDATVPPEMMLFAGAPVIITRNERARELFNGDLGMVVKTDSNRYVGLFKRGDRYLTCPVERLPEHEMAFAITIHKSQGSQYRNVLTVLPPDADHPLLVREILYTGITRAENSAFVYGASPVIHAAIRRCMERQSGMELWTR